MIRSNIAFEIFPISGLAGLMSLQGNVFAKFSLWSLRQDPPPLEATLVIFGRAVSREKVPSAAGRSFEKSRPKVWVSIWFAAHARKFKKIVGKRYQGI